MDLASFDAGIRLLSHMPADTCFPAMSRFSRMIDQAIPAALTAYIFGMGLRVCRWFHYSANHPSTHASSTVNLGRDNGVPGIGCVPGAAT